MNSYTLQDGLDLNDSCICILLVKASGFLRAATSVMRAEFLFEVLFLSGSWVMAGGVFVDGGYSLIWWL